MDHEEEPDFCPLNREDLARIAGDPAQADSDLDIAPCEICRTIPDTAWLMSIPARDVSEGGYPPAYARLVDLVELSDRLSIKQCPIGGRLYRDEDHYTYLAGGSEDEYTLTRIDRAQALELLEAAGRRGLTRRAGKWVVAW